jgi:hypothetical protein
MNSPNYEYKTFEDWFDELEGFSFRSERAFMSFPNDRKTRENLKKWVRAAFDSARLTVPTRENKDEPS